MIKGSKHTAATKAKMSAVKKRLYAEGKVKMTEQNRLALIAANRKKAMRFECRGIEFANRHECAKHNNVSPRSVGSHLCTHGSLDTLGMRSNPDYFIEMKCYVEKTHK